MCKQFGNASVNNLKNLLKIAGLFSTEISKLVNKIYDNCIVFKKHITNPLLGLLLGYQKQQHSITMLQWIFILSIKIFGTST